MIVAVPAMAKDDWFRRTTWSLQDQEEFHARLKRSRGDSSKAQYLRIQAVHLEEAGHYAAAVGLLDELLANFPDEIQLAQAHLQKAECLAELNQADAAVEEFRASLQAQRDFTNVHTNCWLQYPWFIVRERLTHLYEEALAVLEEFKTESSLSFPVLRYQYAAVRALIAESKGDAENAREFARDALEHAATRHSGFRYHGDLGLVNEIDPRVHDALTRLASD